MHILLLEWKPLKMTEVKSEIFGPGDEASDIGDNQDLFDQVDEIFSSVEEE